MKKRVVNIADRDFTVGCDFTVDCDVPSFDKENISFRDLWDCYDRPSDTKVSIWKSWCNWFYNNLDCINVGVCSYNCTMFTIEAVAYVEELDDYYYFYITKTRQEIHKLV